MTAKSKKNRRNMLFNLILLPTRQLKHNSSIKQIIRHSSYLIPVLVSNVTSQRGKCRERGINTNNLIYQI